MESCDDLISDSSTRSILENSINSVSSSFSSELIEDDASSSSSSSLSSLKSLSSSTISSSSSSISSISQPNSTILSSDNSGPLYELSELMVHLPIRRGLSKFYQGKSQSFTSLASVKSSEDLPKKVSSFRRKIMKPCKTYGNGELDVHRLHSPKGIIAKKSSRASPFLSSHLGTLRPSVHMQKNY